MDYVYGDWMLRADDSVFEIFCRVVDDSRRLPIGWLGVHMEERRGDTVRVTLGLAPVGEPLYTDRVISTGPLSRIDLPGSEEGRARCFFDEAARIAGRATT